jgi:serine/threonine-protein kinase
VKHYVPPDFRLAFLTNQPQIECAGRSAQVTSAAFPSKTHSALFLPTFAGRDQEEDCYVVGQKISHYQILEKLGAGGMGVVFKAQDLMLNRFVALKFIPSILEATAEEKQRFIIEARAASSLDHPNIGAIYEIDETADGQMFIAMAFYEGEPLKKKVAGEQLSVNSVIDITMQLAQGLAKAHQHGIIHRDIKPANVIITKEGTVKIVDFGLAKFIGEARVTKTASTLGTTAYMSPEQARGEQVDGRADLWSLGVVTYEILTGQLPFKGEHDAAVIYAIVNEPLQPVSSLRHDLPQELEAIINKCLEKDTADRYQRADDLIIDLRRLKRDSGPKGIPAKKKSQNWSQRVFFSLRRKNTLRNGLIVLALALLGAGTWAMSRRRTFVEALPSA